VESRGSLPFNGASTEKNSMKVADERVQINYLFILKERNKERRKEKTKN
jgi:hypothetical protein